jgi:hypothetical protein
MAGSGSIKRTPATRMAPKPNQKMVKLGINNSARRTDQVFIHDRFSTYLLKSNHVCA